jgi:pyridoxamine 5'-phosphate oxidase
VTPPEAFRDHVERARQAGDPMAAFATLVTVDERGDPAARTVTLRDVDAAGVSITVNHDAPKARHLRANGRHELLAFFPSLMVQHRLRGAFRLLVDPDLEREWSRKPRPHQLADLYQAVGRPQSSEVASHEQLLAEVEALARRLEGRSLEMPPTVRRLVLRPTFVEQWLGSPGDRLHRRTAFERVEGGWTARTLVP